MSKFAKIFKTSSSFNTNLVHSCKLVFAELSLMYFSILKLFTAPVGAIHKHMRGLAQLKSSWCLHKKQPDMLWELSLSCQNIYSWLMDRSPHNHHNHELVTSWGLIHLKLGLGLVKNKEEVIGRNLYTTSLRFVRWEKAKNIHISLFQPFVSPEHSSLQTACLNGIYRFHITF